jgi:hypothetical protein
LCILWCFTDENGHVQSLCRTEMDLNEPPGSINISLQFSIHNVRFCIRTKRSAREILIRQFGEAGYKHILNRRELLCLAYIDTPHIVIVILV